jgi:hypothetical protein
VKLGQFQRKIHHQKEKTCSIAKMQMLMATLCDSSLKKNNAKSGWVIVAGQQSILLFQSCRLPVPTRPGRATSHEPTKAPPPCHPQSVLSACSSPGRENAGSADWPRTHHHNNRQESKEYLLDTDLRLVRFAIIGISF